MQNYMVQACKDGVCCDQVTKFMSYGPTKKIWEISQVDNLCMGWNLFLALTLMGCEHDPQQRHLFIDSSLLSQKALVLHNGSLQYCPPFNAYWLCSINERNLQKFGTVLKDWNICGDVKVVALLLGNSAKPSTVVTFVTWQGLLKSLITTNRTGCSASI